MTVPSQMSLSGSPITSSGTLALSLVSPQGTGQFVLNNNPTLTSVLVSDTKSSFTDAPLKVYNTNTNPLTGLIVTAPFMSAGNDYGLTFGQDTAVGNAVGQTFHYAGNNSSLNYYGWGYYGKPYDITVDNAKNITLGQDSAANVTIPGPLNALNFTYGTYSGTCYGWTGSLSNPTGGPWTFTGRYNRAGNAVTIYFSVSGSYSSAALGSKPYLKGHPTYGMTVANFNCTCDSNVSGFTGASLPYNASIGSGGQTGGDFTLFTGGTQLTFQLSGGSLNFTGVATYLLY